MLRKNCPVPSASPVYLLTRAEGAGAGGSHPMAGPVEVPKHEIDYLVLLALVFVISAILYLAG